MASPESRARTRLGHLLTKIASGAPAPASGSAAAAVVAAAAALLQKVAVRSEGRWSGAAAAHQRAEAMRLRAEELVELDSLAFLEFMAAIRSGGDVEDARARTIEVPDEIRALATEVAKLARELERRGNPNLHADSVAAGILARAAAETAAMLVDVNVKGGSSARARPPAAPVPSGGRRRARAQSSGTARPSRPRTSRGSRSAGAGRRSGS